MVISPAMNTKASPNPNLDAALTELVSLGMRAARVVTRMMEIEQQAAEVVASDLPVPGHQPASLSEAAASGQDVDAVTAAMAEAVPRVEGLARAFDRVSRSVRRTVALIQRMQAGWPHPSSADNRQAMLRRQVARAVAEVIQRESDGEAAERLFDDLAERLDDPGVAAEIDALPEREVVRRICRDLGLAMGTVWEMGGTPPPPPQDGWPVDTS